MRKDYQDISTEVSKRGYSTMVSQKPQVNNIQARAFGTAAIKLPEIPEPQILKDLNPELLKNDPLTTSVRMVQDPIKIEEIKEDVVKAKEAVVEKVAEV